MQIVASSKIKPWNPSGGVKVYFVGLTLLTQVFTGPGNVWCIHDCVHVQKGIKMNVLYSITSFISDLFYFFTFLLHVKDYQQ